MAETILSVVYTKIVNLFIMFFYHFAVIIFCSIEAIIFIQTNTLRIRIQLSIAFLYTRLVNIYFYENSHFTLLTAAVSE